MSGECAFIRLYYTEKFVIGRLDAVFGEQTPLRYIGSTHVTVNSLLPVVFGTLQAPPFGIPCLLICDSLTLTMPTNLISKLTYSLLQAIQAFNSNYSIRAFLIRHIHVDFRI